MNERDEVINFINYGLSLKLIDFKSNLNGPFYHRAAHNNTKTVITTSRKKICVLLSPLKLLFAVREEEDILA